jgi:hypothetical protein
MQALLAPGRQIISRRASQSRKKPTLPMHPMAGRRPRAALQRSKPPPIYALSMHSQLS